MLDKKLNKILDQCTRLHKEVLSRENLEAILKGLPIMGFKGWLCFEDPELIIPIYRLLRGRKGFMYVAVKTSDLQDRTALPVYKLPYFDSTRLNDTIVTFLFPILLYNEGWWLLEDR